MTLLEAFRIPDRCAVNQKVPKKLYYENVQMNGAQKRFFKEELEALTFAYNLSPETLNIPAFVNDDYVYDYIAVLSAQLREPKHALSIAEVVHKVPYPVVLILSHENRSMLSLAAKRVNRADTSKRTIEEFFFTDWIDTIDQSETQEHFLESLDISHFSYDHLYKLYADIISRITALQSASVTGRFSVVENPAGQRELLGEIASLQTQVNELKSLLKKESQFNEKVRINVELKSVEQQVTEKQKLLGEL